MTDDAGTDDGDVDGWVDEERRRAGPCPWCGARQVRPILYGYPDPTAYERLHERVAFAGCLVPEVPMRFRCADCGTEWAPARDPGREGG